MGKVINFKDYNHKVDKNNNHSVSTQDIAYALNDIYVTIGNIPADVVVDNTYSISDLSDLKDIQREICEIIYKQNN